jgi:hypothetical protein
MRFKTKVMIPAVALLTSLLVSLPIAQNQANANERHNRCVVSTASRSYQRLPYAKPAYNKRFAQTYMSTVYGWCGSQYNCLVTLWNRESGWRVNAHNSSGAHGIPQALPGNKMSSAGKNWYSDPQTQIKWGLKYILQRYGSPCSALSHSYRTGWY